ncbi:hypothetical protein AB0F88_38305 [Streptosporangium sp. NPDC023963]|uniref:hypothetical protein n=1 Tax=Streptosporangium sp. NPDC023963 TaxID=3155608 RepID=UPI00343F4747
MTFAPAVAGAFAARRRSSARRDGTARQGAHPGTAKHGTARQTARQQRGKQRGEGTSRHVKGAAEGHLTAVRTGGRPYRGLGERGRRPAGDSNLKYGTSILFILNTTKLLPRNEIAEKNSAFTERDDTLRIHDLEIGADDWNPRNRVALWITAIARPDACLRRRRGYIYQ